MKEEYTEKNTYIDYTAFGMNTSCHLLYLYKDCSIQEGDEQEKKKKEKKERKGGARRKGGLIIA